MKTAIDYLREVLADAIFARDNARLLLSATREHGDVRLAEMEAACIGLENCADAVLDAIFIEIATEQLEKISGRSLTKAEIEKIAGKLAREGIIGNCCPTVPESEMSTDAEVWRQVRETLRQYPFAQLPIEIQP